MIDCFANLETTLKIGSDPSDNKNSLLEIDSSLKKYDAELHKLKIISFASGGQLMKLQLEWPSTAEVLKGIQ